MKAIIVGVGILAAFVLAGFLFAQQDTKHSHASNKDWHDRCVEMMDTCQRIMNQSSMGSGMVGGQGMMGYGGMRMGMMMGRGMMGMMGPAVMDRMQMSDHHEGNTKLSQPLDELSAVALVEKYVESLNNARLKVGSVKEKEHAFIVEIVTKKENALVEKVNVEKETGRLSPVSDQ